VKPPMSVKSEVTDGISTQADAIFWHLSASLRSTSASLPSKFHDFPGGGVLGEP